MLKKHKNVTHLGLKPHVCNLCHEGFGGYSGNYAHFLIHHGMLSDSAQTEAYRNAIYNNLQQMKDTNGLDLGCGTGILSMFCAKAGAKSVTGVDMSDIIHSTTDIIRENNFQDVITLVKGRLEDVEDLQVNYYSINKLKNKS